MSGPDDSAQQRLEAAKRSSLIQVLLKSARLLDDQGVQRARSELGLPGLRRAHAALLARIDLAGTRSTEIAARAGISKQAVGQLVDELEAMGALERVPDPADGRAKLVRFRAGPAEVEDAGEGAVRWLLAGLGVLGVLEAELRSDLGPERFDRLHDDLLALLALVEGR